MVGDSLVQPIDSVQPGKRKVERTGETSSEGKTAVLSIEIPPP